MLQPINLKLGWPSPSLFPCSSLLTATQAALSDKEKSAAALLYGPDAGYQPLRESISSWLTSNYKPVAGPIPPSHITISNGASSNLANILAKFTDSGSYTRAVWMVEPTYFLACPIFEDAGFVGRLKGVPEDKEGIDLDFLREGLRETERAAKGTEISTTPPPLKFGQRYPKLYRYVVYCVPTFSNPSAKTMSLRRRKGLVQLAREFDALVIADDVYDFLRWPASPPCSTLHFDPKIARSPPPALPPRLVDVDRSLPCSSPPPDPYGNTVSNGTFSKLIAPGIRVSWCEGTSEFAAEMSRVGSTRSGGAPGHLASVFVDEMLRSGALERHVREVLVPTYARRYAAMMRAVTEWLVPLGVSVDTGLPYERGSGDGSEDSADATCETSPTSLVEDAGGFYVYLSFPSHFPPATVVAEVSLRDHELTIAPGDLMVVAGDVGSVNRGVGTFRRGVRLAWSWHEEAEIEEGVRRLADVIKKFL